MRTHKIIIIFALCRGGASVKVLVRWCYKLCIRLRLAGWLPVHRTYEYEPDGLMWRRRQDEKNEADINSHTEPSKTKDLAVLNGGSVL